jgi:hypothetical protein
MVPSGAHGRRGRWEGVLVALALLLVTTTVHPQEVAGDSTSRGTSSCLRTRGILTAGGLTVTLLALDQAWYDQYDRGPLHSFDDSGEWLQMDKMGHLYSAYTLGSWGHALMRDCGASPSASRWIGGSLGLVFLTGVEVLDGTSTGWGFSWSDMAANVLGTGLFIGQDAVWGEQRMVMKFSAHHTEYAALRPDLLGSGSMERMLKDYNGQTIWLSLGLDRFLPQVGFPSWLGLAVGYGAEGMVSAEPPPGDAEAAARYRQFYLSPDIDLTRLPVRSKVLRTALFVLNGIKFPLPGVEFTSTGDVRFLPVAF